MTGNTSKTSSSSRGDGGEVEMATINPKIQNGQKHPITSPQNDLNDNPSFFDSDLADQPLTFSERLREIRHNPCIMKPCTIILLLVICLLFGLTGLILFPQFILGLALSPLLKRSVWFVEFLYPMGIARWGHLYLMKLGAAGSGGGNDRKRDKKNKKVKSHSRTIEQRFQLVKDRVYVHPIPQLLDNIGYLIICLPPSTSPGSSIVAMFVDCGDAKESLLEISHIRDIYYAGYPGDIELQTLLCTHKHHDHTAGNRLLLKEQESLKHVVGGKVEHVPFCNRFVRNGEYLELPKAGENDMNAVVELECVAVPSHTRGSVVYALRNKCKAGDGGEGGGEAKVTHLFTGDTMFSGGGGVPFEADLEFPGDRNWKKKRANSKINPGAGLNSTERCFAEILVRSSGIEFRNGGRKMKKRQRTGVGKVSMYHDEDDDSTVDDENNEGFEDNPNSRVLLFPGHEYTSELMKRQFDSNAPTDGGDWTKLPPSTFFNVASRYLVTSHRRSMPRQQRINTSLSSMATELTWNPHLRSLKRRGEHLVHAVRLWHNHGAKGKIERRHDWSDDTGPLDDSSYDYGENDDYHGENERYRDDRTHLDHSDVNRPIFATVYASDLQSITSDLRSGRTNPREAARRLSSLTSALDDPVATRRPLPNALPTEQSIYLGLLALALLGSAPTGVTVSDCVDMNLPRPAQSNDSIKVSFKRIVVMLRVLGVVKDGSCGDGGDEDEDSCDFIRMLNLLWREATDAVSGESIEENDTTTKDKNDDSKTAVDVESGREGAASGAVNMGDMNDEVELGYLKLILYGVRMNQPSWFQKWCLPCDNNIDEGKKTWTEKCRLRRSNGELVGHDPHTCLLCRDNVGKLPSFASGDGTSKTPESKRNERKVTLASPISSNIEPSTPRPILKVETNDENNERRDNHPFDEPMTPQTPRAAENSMFGKMPSLLGALSGEEDDDMDGSEPMTPRPFQTMVSNNSSMGDSADEGYEAEIIESSGDIL